MPQVLANLLIHTLAHRAQPFSGAPNNLLVNGEGNIHLHSICAHITCVNIYLVHA